MITNHGIGYNGRLGNQLFQFAALYGTAKINGYEFVIPLSNTKANYSKTMDGKPVVFRLELADCFEIDHLLGEPKYISLMALLPRKVNQLVSRNAFEKIVPNHDCLDHIYEDVYIGLLMNRSGISPTQIDVKNHMISPDH